MLTSEEGEALIDRVYASNFARADCRALVQIIRLHFWLLLAIQEAKLSLKRFRQMLFGELRRRRAAAAADKSSAAPEVQDASSDSTSSSRADAQDADTAPTSTRGSVMVKIKSMDIHSKAFYINDLSALTAMAADMR